MPRFAANLSFLFQDRPFEARFAAAAAAGFRGVEYISPYDQEAREIAEWLRAYGLTQALFNMPAGDWAAGERGLACLPDRIAEFQDGTHRAIAYARALQTKRINCLAGLRPAGLPARIARKTLIDNLRYAAGALAEAGLELLLEPINVFDMPGYFINTTSQAIAALDAVGAGNARLQADLYHMQRMEGELAGTLARLLPRIGHVQIAGNPGRHEPDTGEIHYPYLMALLDRSGYSGWVGAEYTPRGRTEDGLGWLRAFAGAG